MHVIHLGAGIVLQLLTTSARSVKKETSLLRHITSTLANQFLVQLMLQDKMWSLDVFAMLAIVAALECP